MTSNVIFLLFWYYTLDFLRPRNYASKARENEWGRVLLPYPLLSKVNDTFPKILQIYSEKKKDFLQVVVWSFRHENDATTANRIVDFHFHVPVNWCLYTRLHDFSETKWNEWQSVVENWAWKWRPSWKRLKCLPTFWRAVLSDICSSIKTTWKTSNMSSVFSRFN